MNIKVLIASVVKRLFDIVTCFRAHLEVRQTGFLYFGSNAFLGHLTNIFQVWFVAEENKYSLLFFVVVAQVDPFVQVLEGFLVSDYRGSYW
jgi:hypothetical protein